MSAELEAAAKLAPSLSPNMAGELLREVAFKEECGAYSCFDLIDGFERFDAAELSVDARTALMGCFAHDPEEIARASAFAHPLGLIVAWHWDGDGTLLFQDHDFMIWNCDCKKDNVWERLGGKDCWVTGYWDKSTRAA